MGKQKKMLKLLYMFLAVICLLSGCGKDGKKQRGIGGYIYESQQIFMGWSSCFRFNNGYLYYKYGDNIHRMSFGEDIWEDTESSLGELVYQKESGYELVDFAVDEEQRLCCFLAKTELTDSYSIEVTGGELVRFRPDGTADYRLPLDEEDAMNAYLNNWRGRFLAIDKRGYIYLFAGKSIYVAGDGGEFVYVLDTAPYLKDVENGTKKILEGADGRVYCCVGEVETKAVYEIVIEENVGAITCRLERMGGDDWEQGGTSKGELYSSPWGMLCAGKDGILRQYNPEDACWHEILRWSDSDVGTNPIELIQTSEEGLLASFYNSALSTNEMFCFTRRPAEEVPEKVELVLACYTGLSQSLEWRVIDFNRTNGQYHVTVEIYDGEEELKRLDARLVSSNPLDLLELTWLDIGKYAEKMLLEDLAPYLEDSLVLDKDDFLEEITDAYTLNGHLTCIPASFWLNTLAGRASQLGNTPGWDMEDVMALAEAYPDYSLFDKNGFANNLYFSYGDYIVGRYIDWDKGECSFDSSEFQRLMEWMVEHSDGRGGQGGYGWGLEENQMVFRETLCNPKNFVLVKEYCDNEAVAIGYPSPDGRALHRAQIKDAVGIIAKSEHKEGSWQFLEYLLSYTPSYDEIIDFSSRKDILALTMEGAMNPEYDTERAISQEDVDQMMEMISVAEFPLQFRGGKRYEVLDIIVDEMDSYFDGYKSLEDVSAIIQNRVTTLVQEGM